MVSTNIIEPHSEKVAEQKLFLKDATFYDWETNIKLEEVVQIQRDDSNHGIAS